MAELLRIGGRTGRGVLDDDHGHIHSVDLDSAILAYAAAAVRHRRVTWHEADASQLPIVQQTPSAIDVVVGPMSLRWVFIHMVEEYARHNGYANLLRERIDGAVGQ